MNRKISLGVLWNLANLVMSRGASTLFMLVLARLLAPEAFGLIAMVAVVFEVSTVLVQAGMGQALIRSQSVSQRDLSTVFLANLGISAAVYAIIYWVAPLIADFYRQPELTTLVQVLGVVVFFNAAKVVQVAVLSRDMNFKAQMQANTLGTLGAGAMAVTAALLGAGVWSLVIQWLASSILSAGILWAASAWRPSLCFDLSSFKQHYAFGIYLLAEGILDVLFRNSYVLVIGRFFSPEVTGLYFFARKISDLVSQQLTTAVQQATYPALSTLQDDTQVLRAKYRRILGMLMFLIAPIMMMLAAMAEPLFALAFDARWQGAVPYLQLLCLAAVLYPLHAMNVNILKVAGRADLVFKVGLLKKAISLVLLFAAIPFGVLGIVASQVIGSLLALIPNTYFSARLIGYGFKEQMLDAFKPILAALVGALVGWGIVQVSSLPAWFFLPAAGLSGSGCFLVACLLLKVEGLRLAVDHFRELRGGASNHEARL